MLIAPRPSYRMGEQLTKPIPPTAWKPQGAGKASRVAAATDHLKASPPGRSRAIKDVLLVRTKAKLVV